MIGKTCSGTQSGIDGGHNTLLPQDQTLLCCSTTNTHLQLDKDTSSGRS